MSGDAARDEGSQWNRLRWQCRRGSLELDLVLNNYLSTHYAAAPAAERAAFARLVRAADEDIAAWLHGDIGAIDAELRALVARLR